MSQNPASLLNELCQKQAYTLSVQTLPWPFEERLLSKTSSPATSSVALNVEPSTKKPKTSSLILTQAIVNGRVEGVGLATKRPVSRRVACCKALKRCFPQAPHTLAAEDEALSVPVPASVAELVGTSADLCNAGDNIAPHKRASLDHTAGLSVASAGQQYSTHGDAGVLETINNLVLTRGLTKPSTSVEQTTDALGKQRFRAVMTWTIRSDVSTLATAVGPSKKLAIRLAATRLLAQSFPSLG
eukprot:m.84412 g.84412  ORF g.84412 m.84412 type:complete len:243 (-) comp14683_c0_seq1:264-992(-)